MLWSKVTFQEDTIYKPHPHPTCIRKNFRQLLVMCFTIFESIRTILEHLLRNTNVQKVYNVVVINLDRLKSSLNNCSKQHVVKQSTMWFLKCQHAVKQKDMFWSQCTVWVWATPWAVRDVVLTSGFMSIGWIRETSYNGRCRNTI